MTFAQNVQSTVFDAETNEALIGVTVLENGTTNGTITDIDGKFELECISADPVLAISFIGYTTIEIPASEIGDQILLSPEATTLDEIVVVGYGTQKKSVVTGSISKVDVEELEDQQLMRVEQSLQGRTSGVRVTQNSGQPGAASVVRVRGVTSISYGNDPLYVVDGVIIYGGIDYLNQNDIESIEVLKDGSAAIYGVRGANGVILVTTKSGAKDKMEVNYNAYYGFQRPWKKQSVLNAREFAILKNEANAAGGMPILFDDPESLGEGTDWQDAVFEYDAPISNHSVSLSAGGKKSKYFASFSIFDQQGIVTPTRSNYKRYTFRMNSDHKVSDRLTVNTTVAYTKVNAIGTAENTEFGSALGRALNLDPITPIYETDPDVLSNNIFSNFPVVSDENGVFGISTLVTSEVLNPLAATAVQFGGGWSDKIVASGFLDFEIIEGLKFRSKISADVAFWGSDSFSPVFYLNSTNRNDINGYGRNQNRGLAWLWENTIRYEKQVGLHYFSGLVGVSADKNSGEGIGGSVSNLPISSYEEASLQFSVPAEDQNFFGFQYDNRTSSIFGRMTYNYDETYLVSAVIRRDGSSKFGPSKKYGVFPSISLGWVLSNESFFNSSFIDFFKFRGSWGRIGNDGGPAFGYLPLVGTGANYTFGQNDFLTIGAVPLSLANEFLGWETTTQINAGFDAKLFTNMSLTVDVYSKRTTDVIQFFEQPGFVGFGAPLANIGEVDNRGIDLELGYENEMGDFSYGISGNISYLENEILFINADADFLPGQTFGPQGLEITRFEVGFPVGYFYGYQTDGIFQNQAEVDAHVNSEGDLLQQEAAPGDLRFVDIDGDGDIDVDDRTFIGDPTPSWTYGFNIDLDYKQFDLNLFGQGVFGNEIYRATGRYDLPLANLPGEALGRWTGEGSTNEYPRLISNDPNRNFTRSSDFFVESGAFFRIKSLQIGYNFEPELRDRLKLSKLRVYVGSNNLITITDYSGFDPEIGAGGGVDRGIYPQARTFLFGLNLSFK